MRTHSRRVFDDYVNTGVTVYSSIEHTGFLSHADQLVIHAFVYLRNASPAGSLTVAIEHSGDGRNWKPKNTTAELTGTLTANQKTALWAGEKPPLRPSLRFVRLAIAHTASLSARIEVHVTARTRSRIAHEPCHDPPERPVLPVLPGHSVELPLSQSTMAELQRLTRDSDHLPPAEQLERLRSELSLEARNNLHAVTEHLRAMPGEQRAQAIMNAMEVERLLTLPDEEREQLVADSRSMQRLLAHFASDAPPTLGA